MTAFTVPRIEAMSQLKLLVIGAFQLSAALAFAAEGERPAVVKVAADGSAEYESIQAAIDAAPDFAVVRIAAGTYDAPLRITRPVTLEGAGWQDTHVRGEFFDLGEVIAGRKGLKPEDRARLNQLVRRLRETDGEEYGRLLRQIYEEFGPKLVLTVEGAPKVVLKGLRFSYLGKVNDGGYLSAPMARFDNSTVTVEACALVGSAVEGLFVENAANVAIRDSLVAGIRASGIVANIPGTSRVLVQNCEIRNCGYAGVKAKGAGLVHVDRCRLAAVEYHAVRYDDASPMLTSNVITDINRGGIYADGQSRATIRDNLFLGCSYSGRSGNHDILEHNTFVYARPHKDAAWNRDAAVWTRDALALELRDNVFARYEHGVSVSGAPVPILERNLFDTTASPLVRWVPTGGKDTTQGTYEDLPLPEGNHRAAIRFVDEANGNFALDPSVPGLDVGTGAGNLRGVATSWPEAPEERELVDRLLQARSKRR